MRAEKEKTKKRRHGVKNDKKEGRKEDEKGANKRDKKGLNNVNNYYKSIRFFSLNGQIIIFYSDTFQMQNRVQQQQ